jgi:transcriptional regulator with XRE-family HTH domain
MISDIMPRIVRPLFPANRRQLSAFGERLRLARKRRRISTVAMAQRSGISRDTLNRVEKGDPAVSIGVYLRILHLFGLDEDIGALAREDPLGREMQDLSLDPRVRIRG